MRFGIVADRFRSPFAAIDPGSAGFVFTPSADRDAGK